MMTRRLRKKKMKAKIIRIDPLKPSRSEKMFRRVYFLLDNGAWAKTDIVPAYRNFKNWKRLIELFDAGAVVFVDGITLRRPTEVDADSPVRFTDFGFEVAKAEENKIIQETLL